MVQKLNAMYLHLAKISVYAKNMVFLLPVFKVQNTDVKRKLTFFNIADGLLARGM